MIINKISNYHQFIVMMLVPLISCFFIISPSLSQDKSSSDSNVINIKWSTKDNVIIINYDLIGKLDIKYEVSIKMKFKNNPSITIIPSSVEGDIGIGYFAGTNREIQWYYKNDYQSELRNEGYYFEIEAKPFERNFKILYYVTGGLALVGGLIALIVNNSKSTNPQQIELPTPPGRP